ncbi:MAG: hypothetical protein Q8876_05065 [Bacillota bacterium]|nr:hypothetical protein [Bacillota bacterium]
MLKKPLSIILAIALIATMTCIASVTAFASTNVLCGQPKLCNCDANCWNPESTGNVMTNNGDGTKVTVTVTPPGNIDIPTAVAAVALKTTAQSTQPFTNTSTQVSTQLPTNAPTNPSTVVYPQMPIVEIDSDGFEWAYDGN